MRKRVSYPYVYYMSRILGYVAVQLPVMFYRQHKALCKDLWWYQFCNFKHFLKAEILKEKIK